MKMKVLNGRSATKWLQTALLLMVAVGAIVPEGTLAAPPLVPALMAPPAPKPALADKSKPKTTVKVGSVRTLIQGDRFELDKPVITYKETMVTADKGVVEGKGDKQIGHFTGQVKVSQPGVKLACNTLEVRFKEDKVIASGGVNLVREEDRKDAAGKTSRVRTTITCEKAEFSTEAQDFTVTGSVYIEDKDVKVWATKGTYSDTNKKLVLSGQVKVQRSSDGSKISADTVTYSTQTENIEVAGSAEILTFLD